LRRKIVAQAFLPVWVFILLTGSLFLFVSCKPKRKWAVPEPIGEQSFLASSIRITDPASATQLLTGFYPMEDTWCWTKKDFSVALGRPGTATEKGARLVLAFAVPDLIIQNLKSITLYAAVNGLSLPSETYTKSGDYTYSHDLPPASFASEKVRVDFHLDKVLPPTSTTARELGVVVSAIGFENK
jgi:hypothetical protein